MAGREKPKRKALHRGLDDIINRDASLTSRLLGRVKQPSSREPLEASAPEEGQGQKAELETDNTPAPAGKGSESLAAAAQPSTLFTPPGKTGSSADIVNAQRETTENRGTGGPLKAIEQPKTTPPRDERISSINKGPGVSPSAFPVRATVSSFESFVERWGFVLRSGSRAGKLRICEVLYNYTYAIGQDTFFTSYEKLAKLTNLEKKQCSINIKQLESLGFVERLNIFNTATRQGTEFKLHLDQLPPGERRAPRYHCYDEDLR
jgi:hypothetical protein